MDPEELLELFLSEHPESFHPADMRRFARWAVAARRRGLSFPERRFACRMERRLVDLFHDAYDIVGCTLDVLDE